jgi:acyl dehydratase
MSKMLEPGQELVPFDVGPVDPGSMKTMALLLRDPNPIHWNRDVLERLGLDHRPINQGPINASYLIELAVRAAGGRERLRKCSIRFHGNVLAGQRVICTGRVVAVDHATGMADLELLGTVDGVAAVSGTASVQIQPVS